MNTKQILKDWGLEVLVLFLFVWTIIPFGPGITFDSVSFSLAADQLFEKGRYVHFGANGEWEFAAHRFPAYPIIYHLFSYGKWMVILLQVLLFSGSLLALRTLLHQYKAPKYFLLFFATYGIVLNYYCIWTEGLYGLLFLLLLIQLKKEEEYQPFSWVITIVLLLCLTRMVGVVAAGTLLVSYVFQKRYLRGVVALLVGVAVLASWTLLGAYWLGETARSIHVHLISWQDLLALGVEFGHWWVPSLPLIPAASLGFLLIVSPTYLIWKSWKDRADKTVLFWFLIAHFYGYLIFILLAKSFLDASIAFGHRTLFPLYLNFIALLLIFQMADVLNDGSRRKVRYILPKLLILFVAFNVPKLFELRNNGVGYSSRSWSEFEFTEVLSQQPVGLTYTNDQMALAVFGPKPLNVPKLLPEKKNLYSQSVNETYEAEMDLMIEDLAGQPYGRIIWIRNGVTGEVYPNYEELKGLEGFEVIYDDWLCLILLPTH